MLIFCSRFAGFFWSSAPPPESLDPDFGQMSGSATSGMAGSGSAGEARVRRRKAGLVTTHANYHIRLLMSASFLTDCMCLQNADQVGRAESSDDGGGVTSHSIQTFRPINLIRLGLRDLGGPPLIVVSRETLRGISVVACGC